ncbi:transferase [Helicobacter cholecystus]|nr:transferase [Helicobacter cholecystus]
MFAQGYCDGLQHSSTPAPKQSQNLGYNPSHAKTMLITTFPLIDKDGVFFSQKSSQMLQDMIFKVLNLSLCECAIFSLYKSQELLNPHDMQKYKEILFAQILQSPARCGLIFGLEEIAIPLFPKYSLSIGSSLNFKGKKLLITHSLKALIRLENLKKQTFQDLKNLKALL